MKEASLKRLLCALWFQPCDVLERAKLERPLKDQWLPGVGMGREES